MAEHRGWRAQEVASGASSEARPTLLCRPNEADRTESRDPRAAAVDSPAADRSGHRDRPSRRHHPGPRALRAHPRRARPSSVPRARAGNQPTSSRPGLSDPLTHLWTARAPVGSLRPQVDSGTPLPARTQAARSRRTCPSGSPGCGLCTASMRALQRRAERSAKGRPPLALPRRRMLRRGGRPVDPGSSFGCAGGSACRR